MLMEELILKHKYFQAYRMKNNQILDPLTKTIARGAMVSYIKYLIKHQIPFVMGVFDVDNFKNVNDTYGHQIGDEILTGLTYNIMNCFGSTAVMGRYGGDEFLVVREGEKTYDEINEFIGHIYSQGVRKPILLSTGKTLSVSATTGICTFPRDAKKYEELFSICDKCLYFGKNEGRNCYTIYVEFLHSKIDLNRTKKKGIAERINKLYDILGSVDKKIKIFRGMEYITGDISISGISYENKNKIILSYEKNEEYGKPPLLPKELLKELEDKEFIRCDDIERIKESNPEMYQFCYENNLLSFVVFKVIAADKNLGYMMFYDSDFRRIWQEDDLAVFLVFVKAAGLITHFGTI